MSSRIDSLKRGDSRSADKHIPLGNESVLSLHIEFVKQIDISKMKAFRVNIIILVVASLNYRVSSVFTDSSSLYV